MIQINDIHKSMLEKLFDSSDKFLLTIDNDTKILDYNENFEPYKHRIKYFKELITYTHTNDFLKHIESLCNPNHTIKFTTNLSFNKSDVEDIPSTYDIILHKENDLIYVIADPKPPLSHNDAKLYLNLVNEYSKNSRELIKTKLKLQKMNTQLASEVDKQVSELREKDELLLKQTKDAAMGEMIDSIAHQWKNPLNTMKVFASTIKMEYELFDTPNDQNIINYAGKIEEQIDHLNVTLDEFRSFFRPNIPKQKVSIKTVIDSVKILMKDDLIKSKINIKTQGDLDQKISIIPNQFKHVIINLITNCKDAFIENNIKDRLITFNAQSNDENIILQVSDNAGGIPEEIINKVFEANFTTKEAGKGTGIGLHMTKQIIDKMDAEINVYNIENGVCFEIIIAKNTQS